tara:strand:- start:66055 stop:66918 length:864 start_codon:yes stop_codon:yes gene_type:complete
MRLKNILPWIFALIGFVAIGTRGALIGVIFGYLIQRTFFSNEEEESIKSDFSNAKISTYGKLLMLLAAEVMRADGKLKKSELSYIKNFLLKQMGSVKAKVHLQHLKFYLDHPGDMEGACLELRSLYSYSALLQLVHFLLGIAFADGNFSSEESNVARTIAQKLGIRQKDYNSILAMYYQKQNAYSGNNNQNSNYRSSSYSRRGYRQSSKNSSYSYYRRERASQNDYDILKVSKDASWEEIKKSYRKLAIQYHPDKVAHLGEEYQKAAKEKFQAIQSAYERIKKSKEK